MWNSSSQYERVGDEEVAHLIATEVEDVRAPLGMLATRGIRVLVQRRAVEATEAPLVAREVRRHPVDDHADATLVHQIDEATEAGRIAEARRRRVVARHLVAPRATERVLGDRHQLDVGEAERTDVGAEFVGEGVPVVHARDATNRGAPRTCASVRRRGWSRPRFAIHSSSCHSCRLPDGMTLASLGGSSVWRAIGSALRSVRPWAVMISNLYRCPVSAAGARPDQMPVGPFGVDHLQRFGRPVVPVADHRDERRVRCPHGEPDAVGVAVASTTRPCGPSSSHNRRWVPSPKRCRSSSPIGRATVDIAAHSRSSSGRHRARMFGGPRRDVVGHRPGTSRPRHRPARHRTWTSVGRATVRCAAVRVLMLSWDFPPRTTGGTAAHVDGLTTALAKAGHDVVVLTIAERMTDVAGRRGAARPRRAGRSASCAPPSTCRGCRRSTRSPGLRRPTTRSRSSARSSAPCSTPTAPADRGAPTSSTATTGAPAGPPTRCPRCSGCRSC